MMKINTKGSVRVVAENLKNTRTKSLKKELHCICGSTRIKGSVKVVGEDAGRYIMIECKNCGRVLYW